MEVREQQQDGYAEAPPRNLRTSVKVSNVSPVCNFAFCCKKLNWSRLELDPSLRSFVHLKPVVVSHCSLQEAVVR